METTRKSNFDLATIARSVLSIKKGHQCADCPILRMANKRPQSIFARLHTWHKTWWPGWKAHEARTCPFHASPTNQRVDPESR
jgi:hypothetical protein